MVRHHYPHLFSPGTPEHRLAEDEAFDVAHALAYGLVKQAYRL
jgi:hypothetical protein